MNWKNAFFIALTASLASTGWAVKLNNEKSPGKSTGGQTPVDEKSINGLHQNGSHPAAAFMISCSGAQSNEGMVGSVSALCQINDYLNYVNWALASDENDDFDFGQSNCDEVTADNFEFPLTALFVQGYKINKPCEFKKMLANASDEDDIYAYIAIQDQENAQGQYDTNGFSTAASGATTQMLQLDLIFKAKSNTVSDKMGQLIPRDNGYYYYDFTTPCPPMCDGD